MGPDCWGEGVKVILYHYIEGTLMVCAHLEGRLLTKAPASGTWRPAKTSPRQTACTEANGLTCRDVVTEIKVRENTKQRIDSKREQGYLFGYIFLGQSKRKFHRSWPPKRERQSLWRRGNAELQNWQLRRLCNLNIDWWELSPGWDRITASAAEPKRLWPPTRLWATIGGHFESNSCFSSLV